MKVPIDWLKELVNFRAGADQLAGMLSHGGLEATALADEIIEVDILPNRADALSIRGIAREVSALTKFKMRPVKYKVKEASQKIDKLIKIEVRDKDLCPRYMARVIKNVKVGESPEWLKKRLERVGIRSINNVVDVANYFMIEIGQPMHAFDADQIKDQTIIIRRANPEEKIVTLDGKEPLLNPEILLIADPEKAIACAGIMGGANTEVSSDTKTIILESACFNPVSIYNSSKTLKIRSEASIRFEHGVDWNGVEEGLDRCAALIAELSRGEVLKGKIDVKAKTPKPKLLELRLNRMQEILGISIPAGDTISILKRLGFSVKEAAKNILAITVPLFRSMDIEREIDLIEEVARIYGYGKIESTMPQTAFPGKEPDRMEQLINRVKQIMAGCGLNEIQSYSMLGPEDFAKTGLESGRAIKIDNPLTVEESIMRTRILPGLLKTAKYNLNRQLENIFLFEIGKVFSASENTLPHEKWLLGGLAIGSSSLNPLNKVESDYAWIKGVVENLFNDLGITMPAFKAASNYLLQPGSGAAIADLGILGALHPDIERKFEIDKPVYFFEIDLEAVQKMLVELKRYRPLPKYPAVNRDVSMFISAGIDNGVIIKLIKETGGSMLEDVFLFDQYKDSMAYRLVYRDSTRTLTEEEVNAKQQEIINTLIARLQVRIRM